MYCESVSKIIKNLVFFSFIFFGNTALSYEDIPPCFKQLERHFFSRKDLYQAFDMYPDMIFASTWDAIYQDLISRSQNIPSKVKEEAARFSPNPLQNPFNSKKAFEILRNVLYSTFKESVIKYTVVRYEESIETMFNFLMEKNSYEWNLCEGKAR